MEYAVAAVFGLSIGTLITYASAPKIRWPAFLGTCAVLAIAVGVIWGSSTSFVLGMIIVATALVAEFLAGGVVWKGNPLLAGAGYWERAWMAMWHTSMLRRVPSDFDEQELDPSTLLAHTD